MPTFHCETYKTPWATPTPAPPWRYDRTRHSLDRHAAYAVSTFLADT